MKTADMQPDFDLLREIKQAVREWPSEDFDFNSLPAIIKANTCGCAIFVAAKTGIVPTDSTPGSMAVLLRISHGDAAWLFNNQADVDNARGVNGKREFYRRANSFLKDHGQKL